MSYQMMSAATAGLAISTAASAAMTGWSAQCTQTSDSGHQLLRIEVFAVFNGPTDTLLNVFNFQAAGGWASNPSAASGFWHKDLSNSSTPNVLSQQFGTWMASSTGSAISNRPFDSFLLIGGTPNAMNTSTCDPSWNGGGSNPDGPGVAQLPLFNDLGWFNASPPNLQGRVGVGPNTSTNVKVAQFIISVTDPTTRIYSLTAGYNNGAGGAVQFFTGTVTCVPAPGAIALLGLAGLTNRRRR